MGDMARMAQLVNIETQARIGVGARRLIGQAAVAGDAVETWGHVTTVLTAAANISKLIWPYGRETRVDLRDACGLDDDSVLRSRDVRNAFDHVDERIDKWAKNDTTGVFVDANMGDTAALANPLFANSLRTYNKETSEMRVPGHSVMIKDLVDAMEGVLRTLEARR